MLICNNSAAEMSALLICGSLPIMPKFLKMFSRRPKSSSGMGPHDGPYYQHQASSKTPPARTYIPLKSVEAAKVMVKENRVQRSREDNLDQNSVDELTDTSTPKGFSIQKTVSIHHSFSPA